ncbi:hypothetical protein BDR06DRAFT_1013357 [Suillus hirtellus]|nr:hypothetical protein BDR06DRAFT_1013357 [Suillus hirtellus]
MAYIIDPGSLTLIVKTLAIKIFSVQPSSMPEECTMSVFTWMNSALQNRQDIHTLMDMTQVRQWYMYDSTSKHPEHPTVNFYDLDTELFGSKVKEGKQHHDAKNSLLSTESIEGGEEIEDDESNLSADGKGKCKAEAEDTNGSNDEWLEVWE